MKLFRKIKELFNPPVPWKAYHAESQEQRVILCNYCLTLIKEGKLKKLLEKIVSESEGRQLEASNRPILTTRADLEYHLRKGLGDFYNEVCSLANQAPKKEKEFDAYKVI